MLVVTRKAGEQIKVGDNIVITIIRTGTNVKVGIDAPRDMNIVRVELEDVPKEVAALTGHPVKS